MCITINTPFWIEWKQSIGSIVHRRFCRQVIAFNFYCSHLLFILCSQIIPHSNEFEKRFKGIWKKPKLFLWLKFHRFMAKQKPNIFEYTSWLCADALFLDHNLFWNGIGIVWYACDAIQWIIEIVGNLLCDSRFIFLKYVAFFSRKNFNHFLLHLRYSISMKHFLCMWININTSHSIAWNLKIKLVHIIW